MPEQPPASCCSSWRILATTVACSMVVRACAGQGHTMISLLFAAALCPAHRLLQTQGLLPAVALPAAGAGAPSGQSTVPCDRCCRLCPQEMPGQALRVGTAAALAQQPHPVGRLLAQAALRQGRLLAPAFCRCCIQGLRLLRKQKCCLQLLCCI